MKTKCKIYIYKSKINNNKQYVKDNETCRQMNHFFIHPRDDDKSASPDIDASPQHYKWLDLYQF